MPGTSEDAKLRREQGKRIRSRRVELSITQLDLAKSVGVSKPAVSQWERGKSTPRLSLQRAIAERLETPWSDIFSLDREAVA